MLTPLPESGILDFTNPAAFAWWRDAHQALFDDGVDVIKSDFGEQVPDDAIAFNGDYGRRLHNVYPMLYNRCVFEATSRFKKDPGPPMVFARAGWAGSQRYPMGWGGDPQSDWEGLAASIRGGLSLGMSGNPYHTSDIGGFYGAEQPSAELYVRWLQAMVFASHIRMHGIGEREPWAFGPEAEAVARKWLALRYRLIPYLERVVKQASRTGLPVMRAMPLAFPSNALTRACDTQFMCGEALLVAPIVQPGGDVEVALPPGGWFDLNTRQRYAGRQVLRYARSSTTSPCSAARATRCRSAARCSTPARSTRSVRSRRCGCSASRPIRSTASRRRASTPTARAASRCARSAASTCRCSVRTPSRPA